MNWNAELSAETTAVIGLAGTFGIGLFAATMVAWRMRYWWLLAAVAFGAIGVSGFLLHMWISRPALAHVASDSGSHPQGENGEAG